MSKEEICFKEEKEKESLDDRIVHNTWTKEVRTTLE
jgi:hypothetical protein